MACLHWSQTLDISKCACILRFVSTFSSASEVVTGIDGSCLRSNALRCSEEVGLCFRYMALPTIKIMLPKEPCKKNCINPTSLPRAATRRRGYWFRVLDVWWGNQAQGPGNKPLFYFGLDFLPPHLCQYGGCCHCKWLAFKRWRWLSMGTVGTLATALPLDFVSSELGEMHQGGNLEGIWTVQCYCVMLFVASLLKFKITSHLFRIASPAQC